jgi:hypothetical protein
MSPVKERAIDVDGSRWVVSVVVEGQGWDADLPDRRRSWLKLETDGERRFISPLPEGWESWPDDELRSQLRRAPTSNRRS